MATRELRLRWAGACNRCKVELPKGALVEWDSDAKVATCTACQSGPDGPTPSVIPAETEAELSEPEPDSHPAAPDIDGGIAGASARREYEKRSARERKRKEAIVAEDAAWRARAKEQHPIIGRLASALEPKPTIGPESASTRVWDKGARGEEAVGPILDSIANAVILHDRRIPKTKANIDHIAISAAGVFVVDPKNYVGMVEKRFVGGWLSREERLYVNNRNKTELVEGMHWQVDQVRAALNRDDDLGDMPVHGILCFVGANWRLLFARPLVVRGIAVAWAAKVVESIREPGPLSAEQITAVASRLAKAFPRA